MSQKTWLGSKCGGNKCGFILDPLHNDCACSQETIPEDSDTDFEELEDQSIYAQYKPGAIMLGKMPGYPW